MKTKLSRKRGLIFTDLAKISGRKFFTGILDYMERKPELELRTIQPHDCDTNRLVPMFNDVDGIITSEMEIPAVARALERSHVPLVVAGTRQNCISSRKRNVIFITVDEEEIGALGAAHLRSLGRFKAFGFVHYNIESHRHLSFLRGNGFQREIARHGASVECFGKEAVLPETEDGHRLEEWLDALPKPAAIMTCDDSRAMDVLAACMRRHIKVPGNVSLIGVDNDMFICRSTSPQLTSIRIETEQLGFCAAKELDRLISAKKPIERPRKSIIHVELRVMERKSTITVSPGLHLVQNALCFIEENASKGLTVSDVVEHLKVSRRLADQRFREFHGDSILNAITDARLKEVKRMLRTDASSIDSISRSCGFAAPAYLKALFKKRFGMTMRDYRKSAEIT